MKLSVEECLIGTGDYSGFCRARKSISSSKWIVMLPSSSQAVERVCENKLHCT